MRRLAIKPSEGQLRVGQVGAARRRSIVFGTEDVVLTADGESMRTLTFTLACAQLGYGRARTTGAFPPMEDRFAEARRSLGPAPSSRKGVISGVLQKTCDVE